MTQKLLLICLLLLAVCSSWAQNKITQGGSKNYSITLNVGNATGATYNWEVSPAGGTSTDLSTITGNTATIVWDGSAGDYTVSVQVTDGNNCLSEPISQNMEILAPGQLIFAASAPSTTTCSDLSAGEGSVPASSTSAFSISYDGDANLSSANITIENPDGDYIDLDGTVLADQGNPELTLTNDAADKQIDFSVTDTWENATNADVQFTVTLLSGITDDNADLTADSTDDERTITVRTKPVIQFN